MSGSSTPFSSSSTLNGGSSPPSPSSKEKQALVDQSILGFGSPNSPVVSNASAIIEKIASDHSSTIFVYDTAVDVGFGELTRQWSKQGDKLQVVEMQNRSGAGLVLAGRLSQGTSAQGAKPGVLSAFVASDGLSQMIPSLSHLPSPSSGRLVIQTAAISPLGHSLSFVPSLGALSGSLYALPDDFAVIVSAGSQESADLANVSYAIPNKHVIHLFDQFSSARETRKLVYPGENSRLIPNLPVTEVLRQAGYTPFDYVGDLRAKTVLVAFNGAFGSLIKEKVGSTPGLGAVFVRLVRPWDENVFRSLIPSTASTVVVLSEMIEGAGSGGLYEDVLSTFALSKSPIIKEQSVEPSQLHQLFSSPSSLSSLLAAIPGVSQITPAVGSPNLKKLLFLASPSTHFASLASLVASPFLTNGGIYARLATTHDSFSKAGGISASRLLLQTASDSQVALGPVDAYLPLQSDSPSGSADFLAILDQSLLKTHHVLNVARPKASVLVVTTWSTTEEFVANLASPSLRVAQSNSLSLYALNVKALASELLPSNASKAEKEALENTLAHLAFLRLYVGGACSLQALKKVGRALFGDEVANAVNVEDLVQKVWENILRVELPSEAPEDAAEKELKSFEFNTVDPSFVQDVQAGSDDIPVLGSWHEAAKHLLFREAFTPLPSPALAEPINDESQIPELRPDIPDRTYIVECTTNRRLTPTTYDRNVFHLEFSTKGTGLKYAIGEALGVHGWNDDSEVLDFCSWYGLDPAALVTIPIPQGNRTSTDGSKLMHTRTVFQALQQQIDIFGRPPKSFYASLAAHAKSKEDRLALRFIGAPEGSSTFKKLSEVDTVTFADVLKLYPTARPDKFGTLCELIGDIKPRHYSIASAQSAVGDQVDLLVVTVDWLTPSGSPRFGQCTRYLAALKPGQKVTVSIKPSVMKLPPDNLQPIIMAGLGTGAAPFRAFIQHRAHLKSQNIPVGPLIYYFGSRHRSQEYLYGEELEAYVADGIITHIGLAFSRDQKRKVYIQHKMMEDGEMLASALLAGHQRSGETGEAAGSKGVFYLCGPTWPVPDVYEALLDALDRYGGMRREDAMEYLEALKEEERYVLEVY